MSSKGAAGAGARELFVDILRLLARLDGVNAEKLGSILEPKYHHGPAARLWYMERRGYVRRTQNKYVITERGKKVLAERELWEMTIPAPRRWDGKWHVVLFDIPADKRKRRDAFRLHIKELGLLLYQDSVWVHPYPCEQIVRRISDYYFLSKCVSFAVAEKLTGEQHLMRHFNLS